MSSLIGRIGTVVRSPMAAVAGVCRDGGSHRRPRRLSVRMEGRSRVGDGCCCCSCRGKKVDAEWGATRLVVIVGATGTGKTKLSIDAAQALGGEVVNADKIQLYAILSIYNLVSLHHLFSSPPWALSISSLLATMAVAHEFLKDKLCSDEQAKKMRLSTSFNVRMETVHNWRDHLRLHHHPLEQFVPGWPANPPPFRRRDRERDGIAGIALAHSLVQGAGIADLGLVLIQKLAC